MDAVVDVADADASAPDAPTPDMSPPDSPPPDVRPDAPAPYARPTYKLLSETGLFSDPATKTIAPDLVPFAPTHVLWSDGAKKRRWIRLPPGTHVDTTEMDHWQFPVGTKFFKEFSSPDGVLLETRLIERYGTGSEDYWMGAFVWNAQQTEASFAVDGAQDINGTDHDAPAQKLCGACHRGDKGRSLGFSAIQLSRDGEGVTLKALAAAGTLTNSPPGGTHYLVPGDEMTAKALGYLHANCGHCHNENGTSWPDTQMVLRLTVAEQNPPDSALWKSLMNRPLQHWQNPMYMFRAVPGHPEQSAIVARMSSRVERTGMPPLATEHVDPTGLDLVTQWVKSLPP